MRGLRTSHFRLDLTNGRCAGRDEWVRAAIAFGLPLSFGSVDLTPSYTRSYSATIQQG
jgi:hypothetical protein